jgi:hypothetical protein
MNHLRFILLLCLLGACITAWARLPAPPAQPTSGPGSNDYFSRGTVYSRYHEQNVTYWIITPDDPKPERAPVAVFFPNAGEADTGVYRGWLEHLARRGFIVIYLVLSDKAGQDPGETANDLLATIDSAKQHLPQITTTKAAWDMLMFIGQGSGGVIAYNLACDDGIKHSAALKALFIVQPCRESLGLRQELTELADASKLPAECCTILITGADDDPTRDNDTRLLSQSLAIKLPPERFGSITIRSDRHGNPPLVADSWLAYAKPGDHGRQRIDALDWLGVWKLADMLADSAFTQGKVIIRDEDLTMGKWSDGLAVNAMILNKLQ